MFRIHSGNRICQKGIVLIITGNRFYVKTYYYLSLLLMTRIDCILMYVYENGV